MLKNPKIALIIKNFNTELLHLPIIVSSGIINLNLYMKLFFVEVLPNI